jgi:tRNA threonylcarbamoyladenosine biosynthesis protein TsaB
LNILGIEATSRVNSVAVWGEEGLLAEVATRNYRNLSRRLPGMIRLVLSEANLEGYASLQGLAVSVGPGSFTGIRVGVSYARAVSQALGLPLIGVPTLQAAAAQAPTRIAPLIAALVPSRARQVYWQALRPGSGAPEPLSEPRNEEIEEALCALTQQHAAGHLCGEGADLHRELILQQLPPTWSLSAPSECVVRADTVAGLGRAALVEGAEGDWRTVLPLYLTASAAERKLAAGQLPLVAGAATKPTGHWSSGVLE